MIPAEMSLSEGRLSTILGRTKTTGASRRIKELPVCISEKAYFEDERWLGEGFNLLKSYTGYRRGTTSRRMLRPLPHSSRSLAPVGPSCHSSQIFWWFKSQAPTLPLGKALKHLKQNQQTGHQLSFCLVP